MAQQLLKVLDYELDFDLIWAPGASRPLEPRVLESRFGDGYEQITDDGINALQPEWALVLQSLTAGEWEQVNRFLSENSKRFYMRPPSDDDDPDDLLQRLLSVRCTRFAPSYQRGGLIDGQIRVITRF